MLNQDGKPPLKDQLSASELARSFLEEFSFAWAWDFECFAAAPRARTARRKRREMIIILQWNRGPRRLVGEGMLESTSGRAGDSIG